MIHRKQHNMDSLIRRAKFKAGFQVLLYLQHFTSVSLVKQGNYFVMATLYPKAALFKDHSKVPPHHSFCQNHLSRMFSIKYNNHTETLSQACCFSFELEESLPDILTTENHLLLVFQLLRSKSGLSQEGDKTILTQHQHVSHFAFQIKATPQLSFVQYFDVRFEMPYASELIGSAFCMMTTFDVASSQTLLQAESQLTENKAEKAKAYPALLTTLKRLAKRLRFSSFAAQKTIENVFEVFRSTLTIPSLSPNKLSRKAEVSLLTEDNLNSSMSFEFYQHELDSSLEASSIEVPKGFANKLLNCSEKKCNQEEFLSYLAYAEKEDKKLGPLIREVKNIVKRNKEVLREILQLVSEQRERSPTRRMSLQPLRQEYENKRLMLYSQKTILFGLSLASAAEEMKAYEKYLGKLKSKQKEQFFTSMSQLFHLNPDSECETDSLKFDRCPYVFYSKQNFYEGVRSEGVDSEDEFEPTKHPEQQKTTKGSEYRNVFILAHGYQASCGNMEKIKISLKKIFHRSKILILKSYSQHMDRTLEEMGEKAAKEIEGYLHQIEENSSKRLRVIMVGHSMGGIILRASLQFLQEKVRTQLHTFMSIATPHLGYLHCKNLITETGIKLIQIMHPSISLKQLSNKDNANIKQTFIYKLATSGSLRQFENVVVLSSTEDKYVPWNSARIQLYKEPQGVAGKHTTGGWLMHSQKQYLRFVEQEMMNHLLGIGQKQKTKLKRIHRFEVDFHISQVNLDSMIGRTAHVAFLANDHIIPIVFQNCLARSLFAHLNAS